MSGTRFFAVAVLLLSVAGVALAAEAPVAVSPGEASGPAFVEDRCPTFSWSAVEGAQSYDLVVYRLGGEGEEAEPVLNQRIPGSALGWTPSLHRCLERGGRYAWSVRALGRKEGSKWSRPSLFQVASGPSEAQFRRALIVVERYLDSAEVEAPASDVPEKIPVESSAREGGLWFGEPSLPDPSAGLALTTGDLTVNNMILALQLREYCVPHYDSAGHRALPGLLTGHCYRAYESFGLFGPWTWAEAAAECAEIGGYLATLTSSEEEAFVRGLFGPGKPAGQLSHVWIGYSDAHTEDSWGWITGELAVTGNDSTYDNWDVNEPNDQGGEDCGELIPQGWNDKDCAIKLQQYVCEKDH